ncbi:paired amphipathic helix protein Sin3-like protein 2 isoform X3 [Tanacetum coccineum]
MGGSSSQPRTDQVHYSINAFSLEDLYKPEFFNSFQENTGYWQAPNPYEVPTKQVATSPTKKKKATTFELDMLLESVNSALKRVEELLNGIKNRSVSSEGSIRVEDHFSALNLRCIERLYGDRGLEVMETLRKSPSTTYLCEEVCSTKEQVNQVLKLWTTFLELMLYVPSRPKNFDNVEYVEISTCGATTNEGDSDGSLGANSVTFNNVKQGKLACNGDDNVSPKRVDLSKVIMVNGGTLAKEDESRVEKDVKNTCIRDKAPVVGVVNDNVLPRSSKELSRRDPTPRPRNVHDDGHEAKSNIDDVPSSQMLMKRIVKMFWKMVMMCQAVSQREDHKDGDRDDLDGKAGSEGEAEGIEDANFISIDGTYSDHILLSAKPMAKRVASPLHDDGKKDYNVKTWLESEKDIRLGDWKAVEIEILNVFQLLTAKPVVYLESRQAIFWTLGVHWVRSFIFGRDNNNSQTSITIHRTLQILLSHGRALALHARGTGFDSLQFHIIKFVWPLGEQ